MEHVELLIVGAGAAGMAAALKAKDCGVKSLLLCDRGDRLGGILPQCIHQGFGHGYFKEDLSGPEYARRFSQRLLSSGIPLRLNTTVLRIGADKSALLSSEQGLEELRFDRLILATGCREKPVGSLPVHGTRPAGIFTAGSAQRMVNLRGWDVGKRIVILGSGDIGMIMARRFTLLGKEVLALIEQNDALGGLLRNQKNCLEAYHIPVMLSTVAEEIHGWPRISAVTVRHLATGEKEDIPCDTLVTAVGLIPERELLRGLDSGGALPGWLRLCGNCEHVHEIVDSVSFQAERLTEELLAER